MHFGFRPLFRITFAELSRKYPSSQTPAISRGCIEGKANTRGIGVWLSQSLTFGNLATAFGVLETSKSIIRLWQRQVQGCASGPWRLAVATRSLAFGSSAATYKGVIMWLSTSTTPQGTEPEPNRNSLVPFSGRQWVAALYIMIIISNFHENYAKKKKMLLSRTRKKNFREGFQHYMHGFRNENSLQGPLDRSPAGGCWWHGGYLWLPQIFTSNCSQIQAIQSSHPPRAPHQLHRQLGAGVGQLRHLPV